MFSTKIIMSLPEGHFIQWWDLGNLPHPSTGRTGGTLKPSVDRELERKAAPSTPGKLHRHIRVAAGPETRKKD